MGEHVYLRRRNDMIWNLRFEEGKKLEQIVVIVKREFPDLAVNVGALSKVLMKMEADRGSSTTNE